MASSSSSSIRDEILELSDALALSQSRLLQLAKRVEDTETWQTRYAELEVAYKEALTSVKWLRAHNAELEREIANHKPKANSVLAAREDAFLKLKHARKVIRDLIDERGDVKSLREHNLQEDIDQALYGEFKGSEGSTSTDSDKTARLAAVAHTSTHASAESQGPDRGGISRSSSEDSLDVESEYSSASLEPSQSSTQNLDQRPQKRPRLLIHSEKPPGSSVVTDGPLTLTTLENDLNLDDYTMFSLQSLAESSDFSMRFQVLRLPSEQNVACLYDPIFIDTKKHSYILDWGHRQTNENMRKYITAHKDIDSIFHTFTFPVEEEGWFYIGAQHWSVVEFETVWPLKGKKSRKAIIEKLFKRSQGEVCETEIAKLLDSGELVQFCIELTAVEDESVSQDFSRDVLGYRSPSTTTRPPGLKG